MLPLRLTRTICACLPCPLFVPKYHSHQSVFHLHDSSSERKQSSLLPPWLSLALLPSELRIRPSTDIASTITSRQRIRTQPTEKIRPVLAGRGEQIQYRVICLQLDIGVPSIHSYIGDKSPVDRRGHCNCKTFVDFSQQHMYSLSHTADFFGRNYIVPFGCFYYEGSEGPFAAAVRRYPPIV